MIRKVKLLAIVFTSCLSYSLDAQITKPASLKSESLSRLNSLGEIPSVVLPRFNVDSLKETEQRITREVKKPFRFAKAFDFNIDVKVMGVKESIPNKGTLWTIKFKSSGAYSLNIIFGRYHIPPGAEVFVYNSDKTHVIGALTDFNNNENRIVPVQPVRGDELIVEYFEPTTVDFAGSLVVTKIGHDYSGFYDGFFGSSESCNVDVLCSSGSDWIDERHSVCRILIDGQFLCTGSLINNVSNDGKAYILTANHCLPTSFEANTSVFVFNYESPTCSGSDGSVSQSISSSNFRSTWGTSDFSLVELSSVPPSNFFPYWNGWTIDTGAPANPVCIHHPEGDVKKIALENTAAQNAATHFWGITDWNIGTVQRGSSGGPFYNSNHRVVGQVSAGNLIFCSSFEESVYGKFSSSWNGGGTNGTRLRNWLDPSNTSTEHPGMRYIKDATIDASTPKNGDIVKLENVTVQSGATITIDVDHSFIAVGTLSIPSNCTLLITN